MRVVDAVNKSINEYPSLYDRYDYEKAKFQVLHHMFIVLGNGIEWANTPNSEDGGYLTTPKYKREITSRLWDKPYGKVKHKLTSKYGEKLFSVYTNDNKFDLQKHLYIYESDLNKYPKNKYKILDCDIDYSWFQVDKTIAPSEGIYPSFDKRYSPFWEIDPKLIKPDWKLEGIVHLQKCKEYFEDSWRRTGYAFYHLAPTNKKELQKYVEIHKDRKDYVEYIQKEYEFPEFDGNNFQQFSQFRWDRELKKTLDFIYETIDHLQS